MKLRFGERADAVQENDRNAKPCRHHDAGTLKKDAISRCKKIMLLA